MNIDHALIASLVVTLAGCTGMTSSSTSESARPERLLSIPLAGSPSNAGETGRATLLARGDQTDVTIMVSGVPPMVTRPVHLYTYIIKARAVACQTNPRTR